ncbi:hypothetical protein DF3PA_10125 [Candidatus Defluviicoccus seviourii]|uniref:Uncharacterized protein n=1 Tax=Candidatus Defluviicoccus seviourii TaxID=2565273 RepID=A0A564W985_9PROT|nr:hypothetical protein DF3PA_10125 [Candidatus Defluviicoccus seviourii]
MLFMTEAYPLLTNIRNGVIGSHDAG